MFSRLKEGSVTPTCCWVEPVSFEFPLFYDSVK